MGRRYPIDPQWSAPIIKRRRKVDVFEWNSERRARKNFLQVQPFLGTDHCIRRALSPFCRGYQVRKYNADHTRGLVGTPPRLLSPHGAGGAREEVRKFLAPGYLVYPLIPLGAQATRL